MESFSTSQIDVPRETFLKLEIYASLLEKWQQKINLVSRGTMDEVWQRHFYDSLQLIQYIKDKESKIADLGTGAGFPGMVLAIYGFNDIKLIEANHKKTGFLKEVARATETNVEIINSRIEEVDLYDCNIFISRALASIETLLTYVSPFTKPDSTCIFMKGETVDSEIHQAQKEWIFDYKKMPSITARNSSLICITNIEKRPKK